MRLWPLSRALYPKQLLSLIDEHSLLQNTVLRCLSHSGLSAPILVCNQAHRFLVAEQLRAIETQPAAIILEPEGRNTAPAIALGALAAMAQDEDAIVVVLPSDHVLSRTDVFYHCLQQAIQHATGGALVTFGVTPVRAETGFGYIQAGAAVAGADAGYHVSNFVEKPDAATAAAYLASGHYFWNSGMFVFKAGTFLAELHHQRPDMAVCVTQAYQGASRDMNFVRVDEALFESCASESIDYAVMEGAESAVVIPLDAGWSDIGSWRELWRSSLQDSRNNALVGDVLVKDVAGSYVRAEHRLVSVIGLNDVVVVETPDAVLVASSAESEQVKQIVEELNVRDREEPVTHRRVYRPWGYFESVDRGENFKVKRINVSPGASLSLQLHRHRVEHWVVVRGVATVTRDETVFELQENESTFIPVGVKHRLQNLSGQVLEVIEVQSGNYLEEDDIVRFDDEYGR